MSIENRAIREFRIKMASLLILKKVLLAATVWGLLWGTVVIVLRAAVGMPRSTLLAGGIVLVLAVSWAVVTALRQLPGRTAIRASLDKHSASGGLVMAAEAADLGSWIHLLSTVRAPRLRWRGKVSWARFAAAAVFVSVSFLIPERFVDISKAQPLDIREEVDELAAGIDVLKEEEIVELIQAETLEEKLAEIQEEASGEDPVKTWEALDHLTDILSQESKQAAEDALTATERLTEAETLAEALINEGSEMEKGLLAESMAALTGLVQEAAKEDALLASQLPEFDGDLSSLSPEQLEALSEALRSSKGEISEKLEKLKEANLIELDTLKACEKLGQCDSGGLAAFLAENSENMPVKECVSLWCRNKFGIGRGPGHAPMAWSDEASEEGAKFKEEVLPLSNITSLEDSEVIGLSSAAPTVEKSGIAPRSGGLNGAASGGGSSFTHTVLPRHRSAVKRYFERQ
ncbi:MAG: hypothetical protein OXN17_12705 [Candidatus Poribacteria bacterium]|nr:hypothetical protein [Candidatus Poribacteria bacterium]MDE0506308.1 hypothetical protein [Candidatus Poribacteria bacterium]